MAFTFWLGLLVLLVVSSQARYISPQNLTSFDTKIEDPSLLRRAVPSFNYSGEVFHYDGWVYHPKYEVNRQVSDFEDLYKKAFEGVNSLDKIDSSNPDSVYKRWFGNVIDGVPAVNRVFELMKNELNPKTSKAANHPKIWITATDWDNFCSSQYFAYTATVDDIKSENKLGKLKSHDKMSDNDCVIHFCQYKVSEIRRWWEIISCDDIKNSYVDFNQLDAIVTAMIHELIHCPFIGDSAMWENEQNPIFPFDDTINDKSYQEVLDGYQCEKKARTTAECDTFPIQNPQNYALYAQNQNWNKKCGITLKPPKPEKNEKMKNFQPH